MIKKARQSRENESGIENFFERFDEKPSKIKEISEEMSAEQKTPEKENNKEAVLKPEEIKIIRTGERDGWH